MHSFQSASRGSIDMKSIRTKINLSLILTILIGLLASGYASMMLSYNNTLTTVEQMMSQTAVLAAGRVQQELNVYKNVVMEVGCIPQLSDPGITPDEKKRIIDERVAMHDFRRGNIVGADGKSIFDGNDYSDREYVKQAMQGKVWVSEPLISKVTGELSIMVAAPLYQGGNSGNAIVGVVYFVPNETFLNDIVSAISLGENSRAYMIDQAGDTIADVTLETVTVQNIETQAQSDSSLAELAAIHGQMREGKNGFGGYVDGGEKMFAAYAPVEGTGGWSIAVTAPQINYLASTRDSMVINLAVTIVSILISIVVALVLASNIGRPMKACVTRMKQLVEGDLDTPMPKVKNKDETGMLVASTEALVEGLRTVISDINYLLGEMAKQNLNIHTEHEEVYVGSFQDILVSMRHMKQQLSCAIQQVNHSAEGVADASNQLSSSAQTLSQGTTEQASSVQELASQISLISEEVKSTAEGAAEVRSQTHKTGEEVYLCNRKMQDLVEAMGRIQASSDEIEKILKTIDDIAFQTNILALNAAVEAARAGSAGKGFAVVAEEVRDLAGKSAQAAKNTSELIAHSSIAVHEGTEIAQNTANVLFGVVNSIESVVDAIDHIAVISGEQSESVEQVARGINQISLVVQNNSATAEQGAAASEQLFAEASCLRELVDQFTLDPS